MNQRLFVSSAQNDHPASEGQAEDPAEQSPGVPSEIHAAVFLNRRSRMTTFAPPPREGGGDVANRCKMRQPAWVYLSLICAFFVCFGDPVNGSTLARQTVRFGSAGGAESEGEAVQALAVFCVVSSWKDVGSSFVESFSRGRVGLVTGRRKGSAAEAFLQTEAVKDSCMNIQ